MLGKLRLFPVLAAAALMKKRLARQFAALGPREKRQTIRILHKMRAGFLAKEGIGTGFELLFARFFIETITRSFKRMKSTITLTVNGSAVRFNMTPDIYNKYIDEVQTTKKVGPTSNMLMRAVHAEDKEALKDIMKMPGATMQIASMLIEQYSPDLEITVGE